MEMKEGSHMRGSLVDFPIENRRKSSRGTQGVEAQHIVDEACHGCIPPPEVQY